MLFLNLLNRLFGTGSSLSRKDIDTYVSGENPEMNHSIEEKSLESEFDTEALEGFSESGITTSAMSRLDKKFAPKSNIGLYTGIGFSILTIVIVVIISTKNNAPDPIIESQIAEIEQEKTERETSEAIEVLVPVEEKIEIHPRKLKEDQSKIHATVNTESHEEIEIVEPIVTPDLPTLPALEIETNPKQKVLIEHLGKEIYLSNLKLLDYTQYRSAPLKVEKYVLSGTSADKETKNSTGTQMELVETDIAYIDYIEKSIEYFEKGRYKKALDRFEVILKNYKNDLNANFYGALCYHNLGKNDKAINLLETVLENEWDNFDQETHWFIATIYLEQGKNDLAKAKLKEIVERNGFYAEQAKALLEK